MITDTRKVEIPADEMEKLIAIGEEAMTKLEEADAALARLEQAGRSIPDSCISEQLLGACGQ